MAYSFLTDQILLFASVKDVAPKHRSDNAISLSRHEQLNLITLRFERYFSHHRAT